jgi:hypothetical protein
LAFTFIEVRKEKKPVTVEKTVTKEVPVVVTKTVTVPVVVKVAGSQQATGATQTAQPPQAKQPQKPVQPRPPSSPGYQELEQRLQFRGTLYITEKPTSLPGWLKITGWMSVYNPNDTAKKVKITPYIEGWIRSDSTVTTKTLHWPAKLTVCGKTGETVYLEVGPGETKHCTVQLQVRLPPLGPAGYSQVEIGIHAWYPMKKKINGKVVEGGVGTNVAAVMISESEEYFEELILEKMERLIERYKEKSRRESSSAGGGSSAGGASGGASSQQGGGVGGSGSEASGGSEGGEVGSGVKTGGEQESGGETGGAAPRARPLPVRKGSRTIAM